MNEVELTKISRSLQGREKKRADSGHSGLSNWIVDRLHIAFTPTVRNSYGCGVGMYILLVNRYNNCLKEVGLENLRIDAFMVERGW
jgi:hypothetical protein